MSAAPILAPLEHADAVDVFGGKAVSLCRSLAAGLPAPGGFAISAAGVAAIDAGDMEAVRAVLSAYRALGGLVAVRSSAIGEDGEATSFAGQHATILGVQGEAQLLAAIFEVFGSAFTDHALAYRVAMGVEDTNPKMAIVVQRIVNPESAGVMFTRNPVTGADERVIEAAWGLGEAVVASLVTPDMIRAARGGRVLESRPGHKPIRLVPLPGGGTDERPTTAEECTRLCLGEASIAKLDALADTCERVFGGPQDIEWAIQGQDLFILQSRPITSGLQQAARA